MTVSEVGRIAIGRSSSLLPLRVTQATCAARGEARRAWSTVSIVRGSAPRRPARRARKAQTPTSGAKPSTCSFSVISTSSARCGWRGSAHTQGCVWSQRGVACALRRLPVMNSGK